MVRSNRREQNDKRGRADSSVGRAGSSLSRPQNHGLARLQGGHVQMLNNARSHWPARANGANAANAANSRRLPVASSNSPRRRPSSVSSFLSPTPSPRPPSIRLSPSLLIFLSFVSFLIDTLLLPPFFFGLFSPVPVVCGFDNFRVVHTTWHYVKP